MYAHNLSAEKKGARSFKNDALTENIAWDSEKRKLTGRYPWKNCF
jgi:hypothetical protein